MKINLTSKFQCFTDHWNPRIIAELNGQHVKLARLKGEFVWHNHAGEDELFYVIEGTLTIEFRDRSETLQEGEMIVIPKGVDHRPIAREEVKVMLFEPTSTQHTGDVYTGITNNDQKRI